MRTATAELTAPTAVGSGDLERISIENRRNQISDAHQSINECTPVYQPFEEQAKGECGDFVTQLIIRLFTLPISLV